METANTPAANSTNCLVRDRISVKALQHPYGRAIGSGPGNKATHSPASAYDQFVLRLLLYCRRSPTLLKPLQGESPWQKASYVETRKPRNPRNRNRLWFRWERSSPRPRPPIRSKPGTDRRGPQANATVEVAFLRLGTAGRLTSPSTGSGRTAWGLGSA
jgi:hypothetical protein